MRDIEAAKFSLLAYMDMQIWVELAFDGDKIAKLNVEILAKRHAKLTMIDPTEIDKILPFVMEAYRSASVPPSTLPRTQCMNEGVREAINFAMFILTREVIVQANTLNTQRYMARQKQIRGELEKAKSEIFEYAKNPNETEEVLVGTIPYVLDNLKPVVLMFFRIFAAIYQLLSEKYDTKTDSNHLTKFREIHQALNNSDLNVDIVVKSSKFEQYAAELLRRSKALRNYDDEACYASFRFVHLLLIEISFRVILIELTYSEYLSPDPYTDGSVSDTMPIFFQFISRFQDFVVTAIDDST